MQKVLEGKAAKAQATVEKTQREKHGHTISRHVIYVVMATTSLVGDVMELDVRFNPLTTLCRGDVI